MKKLIFSLCASAALLVAAGCAGTETASVDSNAIVFPVNTSKTFSVSGFRTIDNRWCTEQTEVFLQRSKDGIRITFHCFGDTSKMQFSKQAPDDNMNLFNGEHIELLLSPNGKADGIYYHLAINPAGSMYHAKIRDASWTPAYDLKIEKLKDRWIADLFLPYASLGVKEPPANGKIWLGNFCRTYAPEKQLAEHSSYTASKNFHSLNSMAKIQFDGKTPAATIRLLKFQQTKNGNLKINIAKNGTAPATLNIVSNQKLLKSVDLKDNTAIDQKFVIEDKYIPLKNIRLIALELKDKNGNLLDRKDGTLLAADAHFLLLNRYIYFKNEPIRFTVQTKPGIFRIKQDDKVISSTKVDALHNTFPQNLAAGRYVAEYETNGKYTSCVFMIQDKRPAPQPALQNKFSIDGSLLKLDGKPVYLFTTSEGKLKNYQYHPDYTFRYGPGARKNAIKRGGIPLYNFIRKPRSGYAFVKNFDARLDKFIQSQKIHQNSNIIYLLAYEANMGAFLRQPDNSLRQVDSPAHYKSIYTRMKKEMPNAKVGIHIDHLDRIDEFIDCCDIFEFAAWSSSYHGTNLMQNLKKDLLFVRSKAKGKPVVMWLGGSIPTPQCRTAEELRAGVYASILNGAVGNVIHMGHGGVPVNRTRFWSALNSIPRDVESFYADLMTWQAVNDFKIPDGMDGKAVISPDGKELLLVLLNNSLSENKVALELPASFGKLSTTFTPLEPRVFRIKKGK